MTQSGEQGRTAEEQFGMHVRQARESREWTQERLRKYLVESSGVDLSPTAMTRLESGKRPIRLNEAAALSSLLGLDLNGYAGMVRNEEEYLRSREELERLTKEEEGYRSQLDENEANRSRIAHEIIAIANFRWKLAAGIKAYEERRGGE